MQRILVQVLCGSERHQWINPRLSSTLVKMALDLRFGVQLQWAHDVRPVAYARNLAVDNARNGGFDWLVMVDNDTVPMCNPLDLIATAPDDVHIIGLAAGISVNGACKWNFSTPATPEQVAGLQQVNEIGAGCLMLRSKVWETIPAPWFRWENGSDELCSPAGGAGEDIAFCRKAREHNFKLWTHSMHAAGHFHTVDLTELAMRAAR
jgi:hypothetical protein